MARGFARHLASTGISLFIALAIANPTVCDVPDSGGGPLAQHQCITPPEITRYLTTAPEGAPPPPKYTFYPMAGRLYRDLFTNNFVDLDPGPGILDWDCTDFTYDGHDGSDVDLRTFGEQVIGVPIFAAQDGVVLETQDGNPDMNVTCTGLPNYVIIDHGHGRVAAYWHMKTNSVAVSAGQEVRAGEQIGLTGSSGCSTWPHLHFATFDAGQVFEPWAGDCRPGASGWVDQTPIERDIYLRDFNISYVDISNFPGLPFDIPRRGSFRPGTQLVSLWINVLNLPEQSVWRLRYIRPDGTVAIDNGGFFEPNQPPYRSSWWWWRRFPNLDVPGTWKIVVDINDETLGEAPFEVVPFTEPIVNRPPEPIAISLEPWKPTIDDVISCLVDTDLILDDLDYDIVRYHYVWTVDQVVIRDVTTAAHSDVIPHHSGVDGSVVECSVTPQDETDSGPTVTTSAIIGAAAIPAMGGSGLVVLAVLVVAGGTVVLRRRTTNAEG